MPTASDLPPLFQAIGDLQRKLLETLTAKQSALQTRNTASIQSLTQQEEVLTGNLRRVLAKRQQLLDEARREGRKAKTLSDLAVELNEPALVAESTRLKQQATALQQQTWIVWMLSHLGLRHLQSTIDLIATRGVRDPAYRMPSTAAGVSSAGGAILDLKL